MAGYITERGSKPAWVATHLDPIAKASFSFIAKFWWAIFCSHIQSTLADNTLMLEYAVLVTSILASYDNDWAYLIAKQIHEASRKRSTTIPFDCLIYRFCLELRVESLH